MSATTTKLRAGVASVVITPDRALPLEGYGNRHSPASGTLDPLEARAIVFDDGTTRAAIVTADLCGLERSTVNRMRSVAAVVSGVPARHILVTYSHTHSSPLTTGYLGATPDPDYLRWLETAIGEVVGAASRRLRPVRIGVGIGQVDFNVNRRRRTPEGMLLQANPHGLVDRRVRVVRLDPDEAPAAPGTLGGQPLPQADPVAILFSYVCHPTVLGGNNSRYSGDYPGAARRFVESAYRTGGAAEEATTALFLPGCFGNVRPHLLAADGRFRPGTPHELTVLGRQLGSEVVKVAERIVGEAVESIGVASREVQFPYAQLPDEAEIRAELGGRRDYWARAMLDRLDRDGRFPEAETSEVQVIRLGRHWLVATPGETVLEIGLSIERGFAELGVAQPARGDLVLPIGYANDYVAYLPSASLLVEGGYEATSWFEYLRCGPFRAEIETILTDSVLALGRELVPTRQR